MDKLQKALRATFGYEGFRPLQREIMEANLAGGHENSMSLRELSAWCADKIGPALAMNDPNHTSSDQSSHPFDIPWAILDPALASEAWGWKPSTTVLQILDEIRSHAEANPSWLDLVTG